MTTTRENGKDIPTGEVIPRGTTLTSYLGSVESEVARLEEAIRVLPRVTPGGSSECPFARDLYARKEELEASVAYSVTK